MIPFKHTNEHVWHTQRQLERERRDVMIYEVVMDPETYDELRIGPITYATEYRGQGEFRLFGLPIRSDLKMRRGEIILRHGVIA